MNKTATRAKIEMLNHDIEEMEAEKDALIALLQEECGHPALTKNHSTESLICHCCAKEWRRFPMDKDWYDLNYHRPITKAENSDEYLKWRL